VLSICGDPDRLFTGRFVPTDHQENPMQYMLLIYTRESEMKLPAAGAADVMMKEYADFTQSIVKSGHLRAGDALQPTSTATTVRVREGKTLQTDGPFAETKEQLGGYYLIEAADLDEAVKIAARIPGAKHGSVEVRPVRVFAKPV
jgi:hypothetical protein